MGPIIDLTALFPYRIIQLFAYSFAAFNITHSTLKNKYNSFITFIAIFAARIITSIIFYNRIPYDVLALPAYLILIFIALLFLTEGSVLKKLTAVVMTLVNNMTTGLIMVLLQTIIYQGASYEEVFGATDNLNLDYLFVFLTGCILYICLSFLFSGIMKIFNTRKSEMKNKKIFAYISFIPVSHIMIIIFSLFTAPTNYNQTPAYNYSTQMIVWIIMLIIIIFDCSFPFIIDYFEKIIEKNNEYEKEILKNTMDYHQMLMIKQEKQEFRKIKHDFANILTTAKGFIEIGKPEKALPILSYTNDDLLGLSGFSICSNETINTIIYIKQLQAERNDINLSVEITEDCPVYIDDYDLCRILHNIIDNSLNAASLLNGNKYSKINININDENIIIKSENKYNAEKKPLKINKSDEHGNGIGIIKNTASKYGGKYISEQLNDIWYTQTYLNNKKPANSTPPPNFGLTMQV